MSKPKGAFSLSRSEAIKRIARKQGRYELMPEGLEGWGVWDKQQRCYVTSQRTCKGAWATAIDLERHSHGLGVK